MFFIRSIIIIEILSDLLKRDADTKYLKIHTLKYFFKCQNTFYVCYFSFTLWSYRVYMCCLWSVNEYFSLRHFFIWCIGDLLTKQGLGILYASSFSRLQWYTITKFTLKFAYTQYIRHCCEANTSTHSHSHWKKKLKLRAANMQCVRAPVDMRRQQ